MSFSKIHAFQAMAGLLLVIWSNTCRGQETFVYQGATDVQTWEDPANWTGGSGGFSAFPGEAPAVGTLDSANLSVNPLTGILKLNISTPDLTLDLLRLRSGVTHITGSGSGSFTANRIESPSSSTLGIFADLVMPADTIEFQSGVTAYLLGDIISNAGVGGAFPTIRNETQQRLTVEGNILLSDDPGNAGRLRFRNGGLPADTLINSVISDGAAPGGQISFARGTFYLNADNTHSGVTEIGSNVSNVETTVVIKSDLAFGTSRVDFSGGNALKSLQGATGFGTRTLANDIRIRDTFEFSGGANFILNGLVYQSNSRSLINNAPTLTINGNIYAADSDNVREWVFDGTGLTIVNSIIDDSLGHPEVTTAPVTKRGNGRVILTNPAVAAYGGQTQINQGVLQLGNGGAAVNLNDSTVSGGNLGTLEINHAGAMDFSPTIGGSMTIEHTGSGTTTFPHASTGTGGFNVRAGTVLIDGGTAPTTSGTGSGTVTVDAGATIGGSGAIGGILNTSGTVAPGSSAGILSAGQVAFGTTAVLAIEIGGTLLGDEYDQLLVDGATSLDGDLLIDLINGFVPQSSHSFTVLAAGALSGVFDNVPSGTRLDTLDASGSFLVNYDGISNAVTLSNFLSTGAMPLLGDYNGNNVVDAADYTVWRDAMTAGSSSLTNDPTPGVVDESDFLYWRDHFGETFGSGSGQGAANVPEPTSLLLASAGLIVWLACFRRAA